MLLHYLHLVVEKEANPVKTVSACVLASHHYKLNIRY